MEQSASEPIYTAPPILEAVVQFTYGDSLAVGAYRKLVKRLKRSYANALSAENVNANIDVTTRSVRFEDQAQERLSSDDEADVILVSPNALTWSRLAPYQGWDSFMVRIRADAVAALAVSGHRKLLRLGVRYINRLDVPHTDDVVRFEDYLAINIALPPAIPVIQNYVWRFERALPDKNLMVIVQSATVESELPETSAFLLDIDVVATTDLPAKLDDVFARLEEMRRVKNDHFELSILEKARASFSV